MMQDGWTVFSRYRHLEKYKLIALPSIVIARISHSRETKESRGMSVATCRSLDVRIYSQLVEYYNFRDEP